MQVLLKQIPGLARTLLIVSVAFFVVSCSSSDSDTDTNSSGLGDTTGSDENNDGTTISDDTGFSNTLQLRGTVQDVWTFEAVSVIEADGAVRDITNDIIDAYMPDAAEAVTVSDTATFREFVDLTPSIQRSSGSMRDHIDVVAGVLETADRNFLVMVATPDVSIGGLVDGSDRLQFDITRLEGDIPAGTPLLLDYYFAVTTPADEPDPNAATDGIELLTDRLADGRFIIQTDSPEPGSDPLLLAGNIGTTFEGSLGAGLPAKSQPLICSLPTKGGRCGPLCAGRALYDIYRGFEESWTSLDANFGPGTGSSAPPSQKCPPGAKCGRAGNDPHIRTLDGLSYSPQAVGEFTAIDYQTANSNIEMQWRFSPGVSDRTVSFITALALEIEGTRISVDPNRDDRILVDGQALSFDDMGNPFIGADAYDNDNGLSITAPRGSIYIATDQWSWLLSFSGRGFTSGQLWIKVMVTAPAAQSDIRGMFGNADGQSFGDLVSRDNLFVVPPISEATVADVYDNFVNTWRIAEGDSLFDYGAGESNASFTDTTFPDFPNLVDGRNTLLSIARRSQANAEMQPQAEAVCRMAGVSEQPSFDDCVTDILTTGDFEIANDSFVMSATDSIIKTSQFGTDIDGRDLQWWHVVDGSANSNDGGLIGNDAVTLYTAVNSDDVAVLNAVDTQSGVKLWELDNVMPRCGAALPTNDRVVVQMSPSGDVALLDAYSGTELSRYTPESTLSSCSVALLSNSKSQVFHTTRNTRTAFDIVDDAITLRWVNTNSTDPMLDGLTNWDGDLVMADDLFIMTNLTTSEGRILSLFRIDSDTGLATNGLESRVSVPTGLQAGADDLIVITGRDIDGVDWLQGFQVGSSPMLSSIWERQTGETTADGLTSLPGRIAYTNEGFAGWARVNGERGIAHFDPATGFANWHADTSSFDNNGQIIALTDGGFAVSPFGSNNFVEAYAADGSFAWSIPYPSGVDFPVGLRPIGRDTMAVISRHAGNSAASAFVSLGTRR